MAQRPTRHVRSSRPAIAVGVIASAIAVLVVSCPSTSAGESCSDDDFAGDDSQLLVCRGEVWTEVIPLDEYERFAKVAIPVVANATNTQLPVALRAMEMRGTGGWVDVYDWSPTFIFSKRTDALIRFDLDRVDRMADAGISTMYIQTAAAEISDGVLDRHLLISLIDRARERGMRVVGWYLPTFVDPEVDKAHLIATEALGLDGIGIDIEATEVELDIRNLRLIELSSWLRETFPTLPLAAIVLPPVLTDLVNETYWPEFPWSSISSFYDVWMPMGYWTDRTVESGWRNGAIFTQQNIARLREQLNQAGAYIHTIGGLSNKTSHAEIEGYVTASLEGGAIGGGLYDDLTSTVDQYKLLEPLQR